jgi:hypothetical protein
LPLLHVDPGCARAAHWCVPPVSQKPVESHWMLLVHALPTGPAAAHVPFAAPTLTQ